MKTKTKMTKKDKENLKDFLLESVGLQLEEDDEFEPTDTLEEAADLYINTKCFADVIYQYKEWSKAFPESKDFLQDVFQLKTTFDFSDEELNELEDDHVVYV